MASLILADRLRRTLYATVGVIGYILSPASWWNDAVVNIPISLILARLLHSTLSIPLGTGFALAYWTTNIIGIVLMVLGASGAAGRRPGPRETLVGLALSTVYTIAVILGLEALGLG